MDVLPGGTLLDSLDNSMPTTKHVFMHPIQGQVDPAIAGLYQRVELLLVVFRCHKGFSCDLPTQYFRFPANIGVGGVVNSYAFPYRTFFILIHPGYQQRNLVLQFTHVLSDAECYLH